MGETYRIGGQADDIYTATEEAYKNGYAAGFEAGKKEAMKNFRCDNVKTKMFLEIVANNPDLPVLPMVDGEIVGSDDYCRWIGSFGNSRVDEYVVDDWYGDGSIKFKSDHDDDTIIEGIAEIKYGDCTVDENWDKAKDDLEKMWRKAIIVNIDTTDL